jgi:hypothetical protein
MKNLPKAMANISKAMLTVSTTIKISMMEYKNMAIKVGDKIAIEINKSHSSGGGQSFLIFYAHYSGSPGICLLST